MKSYDCIEITSETKNLITGFCEIILTQNDGVSESRTVRYIEALTQDDINVLNKISSKNSNIKKVYWVKVLEYIELYQPDDDGVSINIGAPFDFDNGSEYEDFQDFFIRTYFDIHLSDMPRIFYEIFQYIEDMSEHYRIFEKFYQISSIATGKNLLEKASQSQTAQIQTVANEAVAIAEEAAEKAAEKAAKRAAEEAAEKAAEEAAKQAAEARAQSIVAQEAATMAKKEAEKAAQEAATMAKKEAEKAAQEAAEKKAATLEAKLSNKTAEVSVTILGIFAGIVLTIVAGLFYSSAVIESMSTASILKILCVGSLVGFVCFHILGLLFHYVEKIHKPSQNHSYLGDKSQIISIVLLATMIITGVLLLIFPQKDTYTTHEEKATQTTITTIASNTTTLNSTIITTTTTTFNTDSHS